VRLLDPAGLECLAALTEGGGFEKAADLLNITQSAVSQRLRSMESDVGRLLVVRSRPLRLTESGKVLLRYARQIQALGADAARELGAESGLDDRIPIAINADSLATWVLPALDPVVQAGQRDGYGLELVVDDQDFTHDWLRQGDVLGCVSTLARPLRGCVCLSLGSMRYRALASPGFIASRLAGGLNAGNFHALPFIVFNRKDDMQSQWVSKAFQVREPRLKERFVPSSEAGARAAAMGWGIAVLPELLARPWIDNASLVPLLPEVTIDVALYWHRWKMVSGDGADTPDAPASPRAAGGVMDQIGAALTQGARAVLRPAIEQPAP